MLVVPWAALHPAAPIPGLRSATTYHTVLHYHYHYQPLPLPLLHYTTLHTTHYTLHYYTTTLLHYYTTTLLHYTTLHSITLHYTTLHYTRLFRATLQHSMYSTEDIFSLFQWKLNSLIEKGLQALWGKGGSLGFSFPLLCLVDYR